MSEKAGQNIHEGHRERKKRMFLEYGFHEETPQHEIIEMLLFYSIPRKDTNEIAHKLLNKFGSVSGIIDAPNAELLKIKGVTLHTVTLFKLIVPIYRQYSSDKYDKHYRFTNIDEICDFLLGKYFGYNKEVLAITTFSSSGKMINYDILTVGSVASVGVSTREIIEVVLKRNATCAIMSHNHPNGIAIPSDEDVEITKMVQKALQHIDVKLIDHIIIADNDYVSMAQSKIYKNIFL